MSANRIEVSYGTLDLLVLKTLAAMEPRNGYRVARRIEQAPRNRLRLNQGSICPALLRLQQKGWIQTRWGISGTKRKMRICSLSRAGAKQLDAEAGNWERTTALVARILEAAS